MKTIFAFLAAVVLTAQVSRAGAPPLRELQRDIDSARQQAQQATQTARQQWALEQRRRHVADETLEQNAQLRSRQMDEQARQERERLRKIEEARQLQTEASRLVEQNAHLQMELQTKEDALDEAQRRLDAEQKRLELRQAEHESNVSVLEKETTLLETQKESLESRAFLYSMGFWSSIGAIVLGCLTVVLRLPTMRLEREKLRREIRLLGQQISKHIRLEQPAPASSVSDVPSRSTSVAMNGAVIPDSPSRLCG